MTPHDRLAAEVTALRTQLATAEARIATLSSALDYIATDTDCWRRYQRHSDDCLHLGCVAARALKSKPTPATCFIDGCREPGEHEHSGSVFGPARQGQP